MCTMMLAMGLSDPSSPCCASSHLKMCTRYACSKHNCKAPLHPFFDSIHLYTLLPVLLGRYGKGFKSLKEVSAVLVHFAYSTEEAVL